MTNNGSARPAWQRRRRDFNRYRAGAFSGMR
jgi:hypothetical protein